MDVICGVPGGALEGLEGLDRGSGRWGYAWSEIRHLKSM